MTGGSVVRWPEAGARRDRLVTWLLALAAGAPRFLHLGLRPLHHDEGTNWIFLLRLMREGTYTYDPANYHGPLFYYLGVVPLALFGTSAVTLRLVPALFGTALAPLAWSLREETGRTAALAAGLLLAFSPSLVYYSRDAIHEVELAFLTLLLVVCAVRGLRLGRTGWFIAAGAAGGGIVATKEIYPLVFGALVLGFAVSGLGRGRRPRASHIAAACGAALVVAAALYSAFFTDLAGLFGPVRALRLWGTRALGGDGHAKPWWYFLRLLAREEPGTLCAALVGAWMAVRRRDRFGLFALVWAAVTLAAYSSITYKTPWLVLNALPPLALLAGLAFESGWEGPRSPRRRAASGLVLAVAATLSLLQAIDAAFVRYDDEALPLVYVQTSRRALSLVSRIQEAAARDPRGRSLPIEILSPDYLPLNWYLRDFGSVAYFGHTIDDPSAPLVVARSDDAAQVAARLGTEYRREDFDLRPGVRLALFVRNELAAGL